MGTTIDTVRDAVRERVNPAVDAVQDNMRSARRAIAHGRHAAEDFIASGALQVRRHPLRSVAAAGLAGALLGCVFGLALGWRAHDRTSRG